jgi:hypothetical protein
LQQPHFFVVRRFFGVLRGHALGHGVVVVVVV